MITPSRIGRVLVLWVILFATVLLAGCGAAATPTAEPASEATPTPTPTPVCDSATITNAGLAEIDRLEVTQGLDLPGEPLVPLKSAAVIAHVQSLVDTVSVSGTLQVCVDGQLSEQLDAINPITITTASGSTGQLVFEPISLPSSADVKFLVNVVSSTDPTQVLAWQTLAAQFTQDTVTPYLFYVRIDFEPSGAGDPPNDLVGHPNGDAFTRAVLPIGEKHWYYRAVNDQEIQGASSTPIAPIEINQGDRPCACDDPACKNNACQTQINDDKKLNYTWPKEYLVVFRRLSSIRQRIQLPSGIGMNELLFVHGWIYDPDAPDIVEKNGAAIASGERVGYGTTSPSLGQLIHVHELLHNLIDPITSLGLADISATPVAGALGWDVGSHLPGGWIGTGLSLGGQRKENYYPIMAHQTTSNSWIAPEEYNDAIRYFSSPTLLALVKGFPTCPEIPAVGQPCVSAGNYIFSGVLDAGGPLTPAKLEELGEVQLTGVFPVSVIPWPTQPTYTYSNYSKEELPFTLVFRLGEEEIARIPFDPRVTTFMDAESARAAGGTDYLGYFEVVVPQTIVKQSDNIQIEVSTTQQRLTFLDVTGYNENVVQMPIVQQTPLSVGD